MSKERKRPDMVVYTATADEETCTVHVRRHSATWAGFGYNLSGWHRSWSPDEVEAAIRPADALARLRKEREGHLRDEQERSAELTARYKRIARRTLPRAGSPEDQEDDQSIRERIRHDVKVATEGAIREEALLALIDALLA